MQGFLRAVQQKDLGGHARGDDGAAQAKKDPTEAGTGVGLRERLVDHRGDRTGGEAARRREHAGAGELRASPGGERREEALHGGRRRRRSRARREIAGVAALSWVHGASAAPPYRPWRVRYWISRDGAGGPGAPDRGPWREGSQRG